MEIKKIITHSGMFHADEVSAVALLRLFSVTNGFLTIHVERKSQVTPEELADPSILVLDIGKVIDYDLNNFDHHQDASIPATNVLISYWLGKKGLMPDEIYDEISEFLKYVSDVDRGIIPDGGPAASFNGIIRSMNPANINDPVESNSAFELAVEMAKQIISYQIKNAYRAVEDKKVWDLLEIDFDGRVVIQENYYQLVNWTKWAERDDVIFMVTPNLREPGAWQILSRDSKKFEIPVSLLQTFRHPSGFMAVYASKEHVMDHLAHMFEEGMWQLSK